MPAMPDALRKTAIEPLGDMPWGTHVCLFYQTKEDLLDTLVPYFKAGLENGEFCVWAVSEPVTENDSWEALRRQIPDFDRYAEAGSIDILAGREWYLKGNRFDLQRITCGWAAKLARALAAGYQGMRVSGNAFWIETEHWKEFCEYEHELDNALAGQPMLVLCTYPLTASRATDILDVARAHQFTVARRNGDWDVIETPELKRAKQEIKQLNEQLERRVIQRTAELAAINERLQSEMRERRRTQEQLRRSEAYLAEGERLTHTGSWVWSPRAGAVFWSREHFRIFGFDPDAGEPSAEAAMDRVHPADRPGLDAALAKAIADNADFDHGFRITLPDGTLKHLKSIGHPSPTLSGEVEYVGTVMDVTERKLSEQALTSAQRELERATRLTTLGFLAGSIAHEINQPLTALLLNSDAVSFLMDTDAPDLQKVREILRRISRDARRAGDVIKRIRALLANGKVDHAPLDLNTAIQEVLALARGALQQHHVSVQADIDASLPLVLGDRVQLQQVLMNLVVNGIEAMAPIPDREREMVIRSQPVAAGGVLVAVEDAGAGLDPAVADRLFEPFFTTKSSGMGIGLSICRSIIESHGGRLWASPRTPHGTIFQFTVPGPGPGRAAA
jgi:signal transduction histidine kinase